MGRVLARPALALCTVMLFAAAACAAEVGEGDDTLDVMEGAATAASISASQLTALADTTSRASYTTAAISPASSRLLLAAVASSKGIAPADAPSMAGLSLTWSRVGTSTLFHGGTRRLTVFAALTAASAASGSVTATFPVGQNGCAIEVIQVAGADTTSLSSAIAQSASATATATTSIATTLQSFGSTSNAAVGFAALSGNIAMSALTGQTAIGQVGYFTPDTHVFGSYKSTSDVTTGARWSVADDSAAIGLEVRAKASGFGPLPATSTPSVGFRGTFQSYDSSDPDYEERRQGGRVDAIQPAGSRVFIGGYFDRAIKLDQSETTRNALAAMDSSTLDLSSACNPNFGPAGLYGAHVRALALSSDGSTLFVGGRFSTVGGVARENLAAIRVSDCALLSHFSGWRVNGLVWSLAVDGTDLYVGGDFTSIGGAARSRVAKLDVSTTTVGMRPWSPGSSQTVKAIALDPANGRVILVLKTPGSAAGQSSVETVSVNASTGAFAWKQNSGRGGMAAVVYSGNVYVGVKGSGGRVYAYRLTDGAEQFWHHDNGDVQALTRYGTYVTVGFHDRAVASAINSTTTDVTAFGLWRMSAAGVLDRSWIPDMEIIPGSGDTPLKVWSLYGDASNGVLYAGGDFSMVEGRHQRRFAVFQAPRQ